MTEKRKTALVTGASSGIGRATAGAFAKLGYAVLLLDRDETLGRQVAEELSALTECLFVACNVTEEASVKAAMEKGVAHFGGLDAAFNAAGINGAFSMTADGEVENFEQVMAVNVKGVWLCMKYEIAHMLAHGKGAIVNCASSAGLVGVPGLGVYSASKHAVVGLTRSASLEYARKNIRINSVCPGMIDTPMWQRSITPEMTAKLLESDPIGRLAQPSEISEAVVWLCSDAASFVNGHAMVVDGGMTVD